MFESHCDVVSIEGFSGIVEDVETVCGRNERMERGYADREEREKAREIGGYKKDDRVKFKGSERMRNEWIGDRNREKKVSKGNKKQ